LNCKEECDIYIYIYRERERERGEPRLERDLEVFLKRELTGEVVMIPNRKEKCAENTN
jgi:hypothetical protein